MNNAVSSDSIAMVSFVATDSGKKNYLRGRYDSHRINVPYCLAKAPYDDSRQNNFPPIEFHSEQLPT